jgi:hypothetical protein
MSRRVIVAGLTALLLSGHAGNSVEAWVPSGAGTSQAATSPTAGDPSPSSSLPERILHRARHYRGNPPWLGIVTGTLLVVALGFGVVSLGAALREWR